MFFAFGNGINFYQLSKVYLLVTEFVNDSISVGSESICGYLEAVISSSLVKFLSECPCVFKGTAA